MSVHSSFMVRLAAHVSKNHGVYLHMIIFYGFFSCFVFHMTLAGGIKLEKSSLQLPVDRFHGVLSGL